MYHTSDLSLKHCHSRFLNHARRLENAELVRIMPQKRDRSGRLAFATLGIFARSRKELFSGDCITASITLVRRYDVTWKSENAYRGACPLAKASAGPRRDSDFRQPVSEGYRLGTLPAHCNHGRFVSNCSATHSVYT